MNVSRFKSQVIILLIISLFFTNHYFSLAQPTLQISETPASLEWVEEDGKWGLYDFKSKKFVVAPIYDEAEFYNKSFSSVKKDGIYSIINHDGETLTAGYDTTVNFSNTLILARKDEKYQFIIKENLINENIGFANRLTLEKEYDQVIVSYSDDYAVVVLDNKFGYINELGEEVIPLKYDRATLFDQEVAAVQLNGKWGAINKQDEMAIEFQYKNMSNYTEGIAIAQNHKGKWGAIDTKNQTLIPFDYNFMTPFNEANVAIAKKGKQYGLINHQNTVLVDFSYDFDERYAGLLKICEDYIWLKKGNKWGAVNYEGAETIPFKYDDLHSTDGDEAKVYLGNKMQVITSEGDCLQNCE